MSESVSSISLQNQFDVKKNQDDADDDVKNTCAREGCRRTRFCRVSLRKSGLLCFPVLCYVSYSEYE